VSDFSQGSLSGGVFEQIGYLGGGDAIDGSGSQITVTGTRIRQVSDKALSVGERSHFIVRNVDIAEVGALVGASATAYFYWVEKGSAGIGQFDAAHAADKQFCADLIFKISDLTA